MQRSPFIDDPREQMAAEIARAVASSHEQAAAIHIDAAEHHAALAKASRLPPLPKHRRGA